MTAADDYRAMRAVRSARNAHNKQSSIGLIQAAGLSFVAHNDAAHLVFGEGDQRVDFWPSTGAWAIWKTRERRRGVQELINYIRGQK